MISEIILHGLAAFDHMNPYLLPKILGRQPVIHRLPHPPLAGSPTATLFSGSPPLWAPTCDQLRHVDGAFQFDALQLILQDQLIVWVDVFAPRRLGDQVVLRDRWKAVLEPRLPWLLCYEVAPHPCLPGLAFLPPTVRGQGWRTRAAGLTSSLISRRMEGWSGMALKRVPTTQHCSPGCSSHNFFTATPLPGCEGGVRL